MLPRKQIIFLFIILIFSGVAEAQKLKKSEKKIVQDLTATINYLASDKLEGRRTGTQGEITASEYIQDQFRSIGLAPKGDKGSYIQKFEIDEGREVLPTSFLTIGGKSVDKDDFFPFAFSADGTIEAMVSPSIREHGEPWFFDIKDLIKEHAQNPHFDLSEAVKKEAEDRKSKGATALIVYNSGTPVDGLGYDGKSKEKRLTIPVIFIKKDIADDFKKEDFVDIAFKINTGEKIRSGRNVVGLIDNGAPTTIVIGGHYDHLGYGEDHNSLWAGKPEIHNGADDNASGTALVIETAKLLKNSKYNNNNYLFVCFSGEELGLYGSKYFVENSPVSLAQINYMINCDMVGRLNESHTITIGGFGTSEEWKKLPSKTKYLNVKFDSSGIGPSDHTSFYLKNIPVLFFFTGTHSDYHKPGDDADKINYVGELRVIQYILDVIKETNKAGKLGFLKTREPDMGKSPRFTVSLGIMPDYTYSGSGLRADGVISGKVADHAGMKAGDVIIKIGDYEVTDINNYMKALSHFKKGDKTILQFVRDKETKIVEIEF